MVASAKQTEIDKCSIGKGMVAITKDSETRDDIGIATYIADDFEDVLLGYHCALITPNPAIVDGKYLNAFMHTRYIQKYLKTMLLVVISDTHFPMILSAIYQYCCHQ